MACEEIVDEFNDLRSDIILLFDLKNALNSAEYELQAALHRLKTDNGSNNLAQPTTITNTPSNDPSKTVKLSYLMLNTFSLQFIFFYLKV